MSPAEITNSLEETRPSDDSAKGNSVPLSKEANIDQEEANPETPITESSGMADKPEISHLPSGSISSVESSESTRKLIKSLSMRGLGDLPAPADEKTSKTQDTINVLETAKENASSNDHSITISHPGILGSSTPATDLSAVQSPVSDTFAASGTQRLPKTDKKPVKFTVRKVSRETINTSATPASNGQRQYQYGNLPENREPKERKPLTKNEHLQRSQAKYDLYTMRVEKINKEISFLTNLLPPYNVEIDYATRNKIARAIEKLKMKQDEIEKKKYSLGIALSRLWREQDERELWVRSVSH